MDYLNNTLTARIVARDNASRVIGRISSKIQRFHRDVNNLNRSVNTTQTSMRRFGNAGVKAGDAVEKSFKGANYEIRNLTQNLNKALGLYAAFQGMAAMITTSDSMTSARNKLNYINSNALGDAGVTTNADGTSSYSRATLNATDTDLTKMYTSAQKVRSSYTGMVSNVSKSMTLAPDAFQGNIDNAIRFQEIMAEAYTLGGASAQEMHSSMYQMIQALGAGILAGDELRSVREGAPLAYKEIEKFAQGLYNTETSLKDLASQGKITSDIVVAAMMGAGDSIDAAFAMTDMTFAQAWELLKNSTTRAFDPVFKQLNALLNSDTGKKAIEILITLIEGLADVMYILVSIAGVVADFIVKHWDVVKYVIFGIIFAIGLVILALNLMVLQFIWAGVQSALGLSIPLLGFIALATAIGGVVFWLASLIFNASKTTADGIANAAMFVGAMILAIVTVIVAYILLAEITITAGIYLIVIAIIGALMLLAGIFLKYADIIMGIWYGVGEVLKAIWNNFGVFFINKTIFLQKSFWTFVNNIINTFKPFLELVNAGLEAMGKQTIDLNFAANKLDDIPNYLEYQSVSDAFSKGYTKGSNKGKALQDRVNGIGDKITDLKKQLDDGFNLNENALNGGNGGALDDIASDTSDISDAVALSAEDLEYLRKIAAMEWKKEYTNTNIVVDMTNNNTINNDGDLDGIVTTLSQKLREELGEVANGVYL